MKNCKKLIKKFLCFAMMSTLVITMSRPVFSHAENSEEKEPKIADEIPEQKNTQFDVTKPVIDRVEFQQQGLTLKEGDTIRLYVHAYDAESGIEQIYVSGFIKGSAHFSLEGTYNEEEGCYIFEYTLENVGGNVLMIDNITVSDRYGNYTNWPTIDSENGSYKLWANVDKPEPIDVHIKNFEFNQNGQEVNEDTLLELTLETEEVLDGDCLLACFEDEGTGSILRIPLQCSGTSGKLFQNSGYKIDRYSIGASNGKWVLCGLYIDNGSGKSIELRADNLKMEDYYYIFFRPYPDEVKTDMEAPTITKVKLEKTGESLHAGDNAHITIYAADNEELAESCSVDFLATSDFWGNRKTVELLYDDNTGAYEGDFEVTDETYPCEWYMSDIWVGDISGNLANDDLYTDSANFPYYIYVINGNTHVVPTYDLYIDFQALDQFGNWETIEQIHKEGIERRQTMQEAGIVLPELNSKYPGFNQTGWIDSEGNEITCDTQCTYSGYITVYARYDKSNIDVQCKVLADDATGSYDLHKIIVPHDATFADFKKELEKIVPKNTLSGLTFQGWKLESFNGYNMDKYYKDSDPLPKNPAPLAMVKAMYGDWNVLNATYTYPNVNNEYSVKSHPVIYQKGNKYEAVIGMLQDYTPEDISEEYEFETWEHNLNKCIDNWTEETVTDDSDHLIDVNCTAKFKGKTMLPITQWFYNKNGLWMSSSKLLFVNDGTTLDEVKKELGDWEAPEYCKGTTFKSWDIASFGVGNSKIVKNGQNINMAAVYDGNPDPPINPGVVDKPGTITPGGTEGGEKDEGTKQPDNQQGIELPEEKINRVVELISDAEPGVPIHIDMADATVIPKEILEAAKGRNINIELDMGGYSWEVNGTEIAAADLKSIDLKVIMDTDNIPSKTIQALAGDNLVQQLSLVHHGDFGFKATLTVNVGNEHAGQYGNLYYHDSAGKLVFIDAGEVAPSGNVSLTFSHASDYMIVMSAQKMSQANVPNEFAPTEKPGGNQAGGNQNQSGGGQTGSGDKDQAGNGSQDKLGADTENPTENSEQNASDTVQSQTETSSRNQAVPNSQNEAKTTSVQTGDEAEWISLILSSVLSLGAIIYIVKKKKVY